MNGYNTYVGARYVPVFDGDWDNTKEYEPLMIVSYQGNSYTSKTFVPKNADINDTTYWALTGNYNAQVESYREQVSELSDDVAELDENTTLKFTSLEAKLTDVLKNDVRFSDYSLQNIGQDSAIYGDKLFTFNSAGDYKVFNIDTKQQLASLSLPSGAVPHANCVCFGNKINETDDFPVLYVTGYNGTDASSNPLNPGVCFVYKVNSDYTMELLQTISIDFTNNIALWGSGNSSDGIYRYGDFIVDYDNNYLYVYTVRGDYLFNTRMFKFNLPPLSLSNVSLSTSDIVEYFDLPLYRVPQGGTYNDGLIYITYGGTPFRPSLSVIDLTLKREIGYLDLSSLMNEPEAVIVYDSELYVAKNNFYKVESDVPYYSIIGNLNDLNTNNRDTIINAINEVNTKYSPTNLIPIVTETLTKRGLECDKNADTGIVELSGTYDQSSTSAFVFALGSVELPKGKYRLMGNPVNEHCRDLTIQASTGSAPYYYDYGTGVVFELSETKTVSFSIYYSANLDVGSVDLVFNPVCQRIIE